MLKIPMITITLVLLLTSACSSDPNELSRREAKKVISKHTSFTRKYNEVHWAGEPDRLKYWLKVGGYQTWIEEGGLKNPAFKGLILKANENAVTLVVPIAARIDEITGITDSTVLGQVMKEVHFTWSMPDIPTLLRPCVVVGGTGAAFLKRYDDGWRIDPLMLQMAEDKSHPALSASEMAQVERFKGEERTRSQSHMAASKKPTKELYRFKASIESTSPSGPHTAEGTVVLTDVDLTVPDPFELGLQDTISLGCMAPNLGLKSATVRPGFEARRFRIAFSGRSKGCGSSTAHFTLATPEEAEKAFEQIFKAHEVWLALNGDLALR